MGLPERRSQKPQDGKEEPFARGKTPLANANKKLRSEIAEHKHTEERLQESIARYRGIVNTAFDAIITIDEQGSIEFVNPACERLFGYAEDELIGQDIGNLMSEPYRKEHKDYISEYLRTGNNKLIGTGREFEGRKKDGTAFPMDLTVSEVKIGSRRVFTEIVRDSSERTRLSQKLIEQESLARLGEMAAIVAHEVKNPIAGIGGALRIIHDRLPPEGGNREILQETLERLEALDKLVNDILSFSVLELPSCSPYPIHLLLEDTVSLVSGDPQFSEVEVSLSGPQVTVACDVEMLKPVFLNILVNSAQAMSGRGELSVTVSTDSKRCKPKGCCVVSFQDSGPGIPEEVRKKIFEPFFTTKGAGTGLGLPIAKRVVELHSGEITIDCPPEGGTVVVIRIPEA